MIELVYREGILNKLLLSQKCTYSIVRDLRIFEINPIAIKQIRRFNMHVVLI